MNNNVIIFVYNQTGSYCTDPYDGDIIYDMIYKGLTNEKKVTLSFASVVIIIPAFLNHAIGQLYRDFEIDVIRKNFNIFSLPEGYEELVGRVINNAKKFYGV